MRCLSSWPIHFSSSEIAPHTVLVARSNSFWSYKLPNTTSRPTRITVTEAEFSWGEQARLWYCGKSEMGRNPGTTGTGWAVRSECRRLCCSCCFLRDCGDCAVFFCCFLRCCRLGDGGSGNSSICTWNKLATAAGPPQSRNVMAWSPVSPIWSTNFVSWGTNSVTYCKTTDAGWRLQSLRSSWLKFAPISLAGEEALLKCCFILGIRCCWKFKIQSSNFHISNCHKLSKKKIQNFKNSNSVSTSWTSKDRVSCWFSFRYFQGYPDNSTWY